MARDKMFHDPQDIEITNQVHLVCDAEVIFLNCREIHVMFVESEKQEIHLECI